MNTITTLVDEFTNLSMDHINVLIALGALALAAFAIFAVLVIVREQRKR